ncbi:hypothetical protein [Vibrio sp. TRT 17S01]|uniref:hypothetical protein n=1 Tax=Vibrio sp. TRT 17S01 TaxID=3418505 RepID=UPI003CECA935
MNKLTLVSMLAITLSYNVTGAQIEDNSWYRDAKNYQKYWVLSENSSFQGRMQKIQTGESADPFIEFRLVTSSEYCKDKSENFYLDKTFQVNNRDILFRSICYKNRYLNAYPVSKEGSEYILNQFYRYKGNKVTFVIPYKSSPDKVFHFQKKNFKEYYNAINESLKERID